MIIDNHKYKKELINLDLKGDCPTTDAIETIRNGYRFCFADIEHPDNFLPQAIKSLKSGSPVRRLNDKMICDDYALSLFDKEGPAREKFNGFPNRIKVLLGYTHLAVGTITKTDGLSTPINIEGHYNLHEYEGVELINTFKIIGQL